ncbi:MAG TPA: hypothetical protein VHL80_00870, partial [Polyangia bacterium]|nr:hypothetical protein [Polyangia bacterium]
GAGGATGGAGGGGAAAGGHDAGTGVDAPQEAPATDASPMACTDAAYDAGPSASPDAFTPYDAIPVDVSLAPAFATFCHAARAAMVNRLVQCEQASPKLADMLVNVDPCVAWGSGIAKGTMAFDATKADACVAALDAMPCDKGRRPPACDGVLAGLATSGTACNRYRQLTIADRLGYPNGMAALFFTDATAALFTDCADGLSCVPNGLGADVCAPANSADAGIDGGGAGAACTSSASCADGLYCGAGSTCAPRHATGACSTSSVDECIPPAVCGATTHECAVPSRPVCCDPTAAGEPCGMNEQCGVDGTCHPYAVLGESCTFGPPIPVRCIVGVCDTSPGTCKVAAAGASCATSIYFTNASCGPNRFCEIHVPGGAEVCTGDVF